MDEIQESTSNNLGCPQPPNGNNEDCLSLNVYTPQVKKNIETKAKQYFPSFGLYLL